jgi:hypothetical protein
MGLPVENVKVKISKKTDKPIHKPVADYVLERDRTHPREAPGGISWEKWLQTHRVELQRDVNATIHRMARQQDGRAQ